MIIATVCRKARSLRMVRIKAYVSAAASVRMPPFVLQSSDIRRRLVFIINHQTGLGLLLLRRISAARLQDEFATDADDLICDPRER